jgi:hypothetical protein
MNIAIWSMVKKNSFVRPAGSQCVNIDDRYSNTRVAPKTAVETMCQAVPVLAECTTISTRAATPRRAPARCETALASSSSFVNFPVFKDVSTLMLLNEPARYNFCTL